MKRQLKFAFVLLLSTAFLMACRPIQETARDLFYAAKGDIELAQSKHPECSKVSEPEKTCGRIQKAVSAQNLLGDAIEQYCGGTNFQQTGVCHPDKDLAPKLQLALQNLQRILADVKELTK